MLAVRSALRSLSSKKGAHAPCLHRAFWPFSSGKLTTSTDGLPDIKAKRTEVCLHGRRWLDPFRFLQYDKSALQQYVQAETRYAEKWMQPLAALQRQLQIEMLQKSPDQQQESLPAPMGEWCYMTRASEDTGGLIFVRRDAAGYEQTVLDLSDPQHAHTALGQMKISHSQDLVACTLETSPGSERYIGQIQDIATGDIIDTIPNADGLEFAADNISIVYTVPDATGRPHQVRLHSLGSSCSSELCLMEESEQDTHLHVGSTKDGRYLLLNANSKSTSEVHLLDSSDPWNAKPVVVQPRQQGMEYYVEHHDGTLYIMTNACDEGEMCIVMADASELPKRMAAMKRLPLTEPGECIEDMDIFHRALVLYMRSKGMPCIKVLPLRTGCNKNNGDLPACTIIHLPEGYTELSPGPNPDYFAETIYVEFSSPVAPPRHFMLDLNNPKGLQPLDSGQQLGTAEQPQYRLEHLTAASSDSAAVPLTIAYREGAGRPGPLLLTAYGAYGMCADTGFRPETVSLLERGWMIAIAHIRGGGELGRAWHHSATGTKKLTSVRDLEACMDYLVQQGYTEHGMIAMVGHSAGALPMAKLMNQRPASIAAAILYAPLVDFLGAMTDKTCHLRVHEAGEFGDPCTDAEVLDAMLKLCPYVNLKPGKLPAVLIRIGLDDVRVPFWGPAKYAAKLRACQQGTAPVLLVARPGGHFADDNDGFRDTSADYAFMLHVMASRTGTE